jgi:hypothetical protein
MMHSIMPHLKRVAHVFLSLFFTFMKDPGLSAVYGIAPTTLQEKVR